MPFSAKIKETINNAWNDGSSCLLGTVGANGPNISPKGSLYIYDDNHFAFWERSKTSAHENLKHDKRVVVCYAKAGARFDGPNGTTLNGYLRFYGTAEVYESGPIKDAIFARLTKREQEHEGADKGVGVLIKIERSADVRGQAII